MMRLVEASELFRRVDGAEGHAAERGQVAPELALLERRGRAAREARPARILV